MSTTPYIQSSMLPLKNLNPIVSVASQSPNQSKAYKLVGVIIIVALVSLAICAVVANHERWSKLTNFFKNNDPNPIGNKTKDQLKIQSALQAQLDAGFDTNTILNLQALENAYKSVYCY